MSMQLFAILCSLATGACHEQLITNSDFDPSLSMIACQMGEPRIVEWMKDHPGNTLAGWKCQMGNRGSKA